MRMPLSMYTSMNIHAHAHVRAKMCERSDVRLPSTCFSTTSCFLSLHRRNTACSTAMHKRNLQLQCQLLLILRVSLRRML